MPIAVGKASISSEVGGQHNVEQLAKISRDFRSKRHIDPSICLMAYTTESQVADDLHLHSGDTITVPTDSMLVAGIQASRGDDVYHDDKATTDLERRIATLTGKECGLFLVSGTMSNRESSTDPVA